MVAHAEPKAPNEIGFHINALSDKTPKKRKSAVGRGHFLQVEFKVGALHVHSLLGQMISKRAFVDIFIGINQEHDLLVG